MLCGVAASSVDASKFFPVGWPNGRAPVLQTGRESSILSLTTVMSDKLPACRT